MVVQSYEPHLHTRLRINALAAGLALALAGMGLADARAADMPEIPQSWPLLHERSAQLTPLRARMDAMRVARPAPAGHRAQTLAVTRCEDDNSAGSLRAAIDGAISGDTVDLSLLTCSVITLEQGALKVTVDDLSLRGPGASALTIDGNEQDRAIYHNAAGTLTIENVTIAHGRFVATGNDISFGGCIATAGYLTLTDAVVRDCHATGVGSYGGAVLSGPLTMTRSTISGSTAFGDHPVNGTAAYGGGAFSYGVDLVDSTISGNSAIGTHNPPLTHFEIAGGLFVARNGGLIERSTISNNYAIRFAGGLTQEGDLILRNSTISGNRTRDDDGGGMRVRQITSVSIENSTITDNQAGSFGGGISFINNALPSTFISSIVAGNRAGQTSDDVESTMALPISGANNLIQAQGSGLVLPADTLDGDPQLLPLADNGGATLTHALAAGSAAIDHGNNSSQLATDQRGSGFARTVNGTADIGAFEVQGVPNGTANAIALPGPGIWASMMLAMLLMLVGVRRVLSGARVGT